MNPAERGFTLLEILVALAIITVGMAAVAKTLSGAVNVMQVAEDRLIGSWVGSNRLAELRIERAWPGANTRDAKVFLGGRTWFFRETVSRTRDQDLLRVDIAVYSDPDQERLAASLFGYLSRYTPPNIVPLGNENNQEGLGEGNSAGDAGDTGDSGEPVSNDGAASSGEVSEGGDG